MEYRELTATSATITTKGFGMKLYLDTGNVNEIREAASVGLVDGVTTNPSLASKEGRDFKDLLLEICGIVDGPISAEVVSVEAAAHGERRKRMSQDSQEYRGEMPHHSGRAESHQAVVQRRNLCQRHVVFLSDSSLVGRQSGGMVRLALHWSSGRCQLKWHGAYSTNPDDL